MLGIIVDEKTRVVVQGITGREGSFHTQYMLNYGTNIVAGVSPGKGGTSVHEIPVYDTVEEAVKLEKANTSIIFVPAAYAKDAILEAMDAEIKTIVVITEGIPVKDTVECVSRAKNKNVTIIGPNTPGIINPNSKVKVGIMPNHMFSPGTIGIVSRSGTLTYEVAWEISKAELGQSTCLGLGGDPVTGLSFVDVLEKFRVDEQTEAVVLIGEIGGNAEELAAKYVEEVKYSKPVVAYVAGRTAPPGKRMGHAGAIIMGTVGTAESKIEALNSAGVLVAEKPKDIVRLLVEALKR
jgi:succinyl-CoA synthetase alpha subunit